MGKIKEKIVPNNNVSKILKKVFLCHMERNTRLSSACPHIKAKKIKTKLKMLK